MNDKTTLNHTAAILAEAPLTGLYAITDTQWMAGDLLFTKTEAVLRGGCRLLQYRRKQVAAEVAEREARQLRELCRQYGAIFVVNDDLALALAVQADGIHVGQTDQSLRAIRRQVGEQILVGVSCHNSLSLAQAAQANGASYVAFGRFFASHTKPQAPAAELEILQRAKQRLQIPVVAIGGITRDNAPRVIEQGADMVAVIHDLFATDDLAEIETRARFLSRLFGK